MGPIVRRTAFFLKNSLNSRRKRFYSISFPFRALINCRNIFHDFVPPVFLDYEKIRQEDQEKNNALENIAAYCAIST